MRTMIEKYSSALGERYYQISHKSGLDIYVFPKKLTATYALFATKYGSIDNCFRTENGEIVTVPDGIAHYLEHRMFTQADGSDITERFSEFGADSNAYTTFTKTAYLFSCTENFEKSLAALLDFVTEPYFTEELVEKERGIIAQEIKMCEDDPYDRCFCGLLEALYQENAVRREVVGTEDSVNQITAQMLNACYRTFYTPNNMALIVCGDVRPERVARIVNKTLPKSYTPVRVERVYPEEPRAVATPLKEAYMNVSKPIFSIGVKDVDFFGEPAVRSKRDAAMSVLCEMLFSRSGELYNRLFEENIITPDFSYGYSISDTFAFVSVSGEAENPSTVLCEIKKYLCTVKEKGLSREDFERSRRVLYADYVKGFDSTDEIANSMLEFLFDGGDILDYGEILKAVTFEEVEALLQGAFEEDLFAMSVVYPDAQGRKE